MTNEELLTSNEELRVATHQLQVYNEEICTQAETLRLHWLMAEAPAMIAVLIGPDHMVELASDDFRARFDHRKLVGSPLRRVLPELEGQPFFDQLD